MMRSLRLGLCFRPEVLQSLRWRKRLITCDVLLFPELANGGYAALSRGAAPLLPTDRFFEQFRKFSREADLTCIAGSAYLSNPRARPTNTSFVYSRGKEICRYDKIHLFKPSGDRRYFAPGRSAGIFAFSAAGMRLKGGVIICYDLRFPELTRLLAFRGARLLFVPARWPREREDAWRTLLKARAMENQMFVAGCNAVDREGGRSYVFDPLGLCVWSGRRDDGPSAAVVTLNLSRLAAARKQHQNLQDAGLLAAMTAKTERGGGNLRAHPRGRRRTRG